MPQAVRRFSSRIAQCAFLFAISVSCLCSGAFAEKTGMGSILLSGAQKQLYLVDLETRKVEKLSNGQDHGMVWTSYDNLQKISDRYFLFESVPGSVGIYDLEKRQEKFLFKHSYCPMYFGQSVSFVFAKVKRTKSGFDRGLYQVGTLGGEPQRLRDLDAGGISKCPVKLNEREAVVFLSHYPEKIVALFDSVDVSFKILNMNKFEPVFGLKNGNILGSTKSGYSIFDLDGNKVKTVGDELINRFNMFPIAYFREVDSVLVHEYRERLFKGQTSDIWMVDLNTLKKNLLIKGFPVTKKGAIYLNSQ